MGSSRALAPEACRHAAGLLLDARRELRPIAVLPPDCRPRGMADGYAIQRAMLALMRSPGGGRLAGFKIGATSRAAQELLHTDTPFYGCLLQDAVHESPAELSAGRFLFRLIEPEFAVRLGDDLPPRGTAYARDDVARVVASVHPAFEVVTSAFGEAWTEAGAAALTADNGAHGAFVLGPGLADWRELDLASHEVVFGRNGQEVGRGHGANALGHPFEALAWLAGQDVCDGRGLKAGDLVSTGVVAPFIYVEAGDELRADFGALGEISLRFGA